MEDETPIIDIDNVQRLSVEDGDALIVTLPPNADMMPNDVRERYIKSIQETFEQIFHDKQIRVIIIPNGMKVEVLLTSQLEDKDEQ